MVKKFYAYVQKGIKGYNPPDYYRTLNAKADAEAFKTEFKTNPIKGQECMHSMDNNMGKAVITASNPIQREAMHVILIEVKDIRETYTLTDFYVGVIDKINNISATQIEVTYTIDWFTSYALNYWELVGDTYIRNSTPSLKASTVLYRRLTAGEFDYKDEGFIGAKVTADTIQLNCTADDNSFWFMDENNVTQHYDPYDGNFFNYGGGPTWNTPEYIVYRDTIHNRTVSCIAVGLTLDLNDETDLKTFLGYFGITFEATEHPSPDGLLFMGYLPIPAPIAVRWHKRIGGNITGTMFGVYVMSPELGGDFYIYANELVKCTEYNKLRIESGDGAILYDIPLGKTLTNTCTKDANGRVIENDNLLKVHMYISNSLTTPVITLKIDSDDWKQSSTTITLPIYTNVYIVDTYQVYRAQERTYQMSMLSLQSQNELVNGIIGGINQGAMISAFSRTGARTGSQAIDKGLIGGGIGVAGALTNYLYQDMVANKQATEINDRYNRCKPDVLAQDGYLDHNLLMANSGLRCYKYDADTISNIQAYQSRFGYQTQKVESNVDLKAFTGYVQADVIFGIEERTEGSSTEIIGLRTEVEKYIKDMFNYGVWFTHTS